MTSAKWWLAYAISVAAYWAARWLRPEADPDWSALAYFAVLALATFVLVRARQVELGPTRARDVLIGVAGFAIVGQAWPLVQSLFDALDWPMFWPGFSAPSGHLALRIAVASSAIVVAPICEEVWFRGYGYVWLRGLNVRPWPAVGLLSLAFGAVHLYGGPGFALFVTVWSLGVGSVRVWSGALTAPITMHVLNNVFAHVLVPLAFA